MMRRLANDGAGYLFDSKAAVEDVRALLGEIGRLGRRVYAAYEQGHKDACQDGDCVLRPSGDASRICGLSGNYGPFMEPLACGHPKGHDGDHAWVSLPTFVNGKPVQDV
jgi:hypothetical protein